jgi:pyrimidine operon attenuation protein / uracil phosphoribosyltransferase
MNPASTRLPNLHVKGRLMSGSEIERTLVRLAHQIVEKNNGVENLVLVGIKRRGVPLATRLAALIQQIQKTTPLGTDIVDKNVILLDDVLYTGRTVRAAMDALFDHGRPRRVQLCVLIDRGHRELPIEAAFVGRTVQTSDTEIIEVKLNEIDQEEQVLLVERIS